MKCRRSTQSPGAKLRGSTAKAIRAAQPASRSSADQAPGPVPAAASASAPAAELRVDGRTEGSIRYAGTVIVGPLGAVRGDIIATAILIEGQVNGDLYAADTLRLAASARVVGDLQSPRVAVARGAQLRGRISMRRELAPATELDDQAVDQVLSGQT